jgi:hypothetical protein
MDLEAHTLTGTTSPRWAKMLALFCFAVACGILIGSLARAEAGPAAFRSAMTSSQSIT